MRILVVGAGAVGQTYARHLQKGGAEVHFLVKKQHEKATKKGFLLYAHQIGRVPQSERWQDFGVITSAKEVGRSRWDQVWLCMSSTALKGPWLDELIPQLGQATVVGLQPGLRDREYLLSKVPEGQLVTGLITLIAYQTPLPGERLDPGVAFFFPPMTPNPFSGPKVRVREVVDALAKGGCPAVVHADIVQAAGAGASLLGPVIAGLEVEQWSLARLAASPTLKLATRAAKEAMAIAARYLGSKPSFLRHLVGPALLRPLLTMAPKVMPFDLEVYLKYHFTKVGDQTRDMLATNISLGREFGLPVSGLEELLAKLG